MSAPTRDFRKWLRGRDLNPRPLGYEPNELPDCSTPRPCSRTPNASIAPAALQAIGSSQAGQAHDRAVARSETSEVIRSVTTVDLNARLTLPTYADVERAAAQIAGVAHRTPVATSRTVNARTGAEVFFKCENLQQGGAFKFRGAYNALSRLDAEERRRGVVTFSSGNHAQAIALAGKVLDVPRVIVMPSDAPEVKRAATAAYGGEVVLYDR